jgi:hypothetical protein
VCGIGHVEEQCSSIVRSTSSSERSIYLSRALPSKLAMAGAPHLKLLERSAIVSWCPEKPIGSPTLLAAGTVAGTVDITFSTNSVLEVRDLVENQGGGPGKHLP